MSELKNMVGLFNIPPKEKIAKSAILNEYFSLWHILFLQALPLELHYLPFSFSFSDSWMVNTRADIYLWVL